MAITRPSDIAFDHWANQRRRLHYFEYYLTIEVSATFRPGWCVCPWMNLPDPKNCIAPNKAACRGRNIAHGIPQKL